jgi:hypothetical protein
MHAQVFLNDCWNNDAKLARYADRRVTEVPACTQVPNLRRSASRSSCPSWVVPPDRDPIRLKRIALLLPFAPSFRWLLDRSDSPWYPTRRLYRQPAIGDWDTPLDRLRQELAVVASRPVKPR